MNIARLFGISPTILLLAGLTGCSAHLAIDAPDEVARCDIQLRDERAEQANVVRFANRECVTPRPVADIVSAAACKTGIQGTGALVDVTLGIHVGDNGFGQPEGKLELHMDDGRIVRAFAKAEPTPRYRPGFSYICEVGFERVLNALATDPKIIR